MRFVQVEFDRSYTGGDYDKVGEFLLLEEEGLTDENLPERFEAKTGLGPEHIIHYTFDELFDANGDPID